MAGDQREPGWREDSQASGVETQGVARGRPELRHQAAACATAALTPVPAGMGTIARHQDADYHPQPALHTRRREPLPDPAWHAAIRHHHPDDAHRLANNAEHRGRDHEALTLYQQLADNGETNAI